MGRKTSEKKRPRMTGSLYRKRGRWYWSVRPPGERKFRNIALVPAGKRAATRNKLTAQAIQKRLWTQWQDKNPRAPKGFAHWVEQYKAVNALESSLRTADRNAKILTAFAARYDIDQPYQITQDMVQGYLIFLHKDKKLSAATVHKYRNAIRKFCRFLIPRGEIDGNPAAKDMVVVPRIYHPPPRYLTDEQVRAFLAEAKYSPLLPAIRLVLDTGLRLGEIQSLKQKHIRNGSLVVGADNPNKTYQWRVLPIGKHVIRLLPTGDNDDPVFPPMEKQEWVKRLRTITEDLPVFGELEGRRAGNQWHLLRSTWAVNQARSGKTLWDLMALGGWTNPQTVMRYINIAHAAEPTKALDVAKRIG